MSLYVIDTPLVREVVTDLLSIWSVGGFELDTLSGEITYTYSSTQAKCKGCEIMAALIETDAQVTVQGEPPEWTFMDYSGANLTLRQAGGVTFWDQFPDPTQVNIVYDPTNCGGAGRWAQGRDNPISFPTPILLFHELAHAYNFVTGVFAGFPVYDHVSDENAAINVENEFRASLGICNLRTMQGCRAGDGGGCNPPPGGQPPPPKPPDLGKGWPCFIATAAYGSPLEPAVQFLRSFRDDVLRQTRAGKEFFDHFYRHYYRVSPIITDLMERDKDIKELVRWVIVSPIVKYLELLMRFPDEPVEHLDEPWSSFLQGLRNDLEGWAKEISFPDNFQGLSTSDAAKEMEIVMRYGLRQQATKEAYLSHLEKLSQIPLRAAPNEKREVARQLRASGISKNEIKRILGDGDI